MITVKTKQIRPVVLLYVPQTTEDAPIEPRGDYCSALVRGISLRPARIDGILYPKNTSETSSFLETPGDSNITFSSTFGLQLQEITHPPLARPPNCRRHAPGSSELTLAVTTSPLTTRPIIPVASTRGMHRRPFGDRGCGHGTPDADATAIIIKQSLFRSPFDLLWTRCAVFATNSLEVSPKSILCLLLPVRILARVQIGGVKAKGSAQKHQD